ncbi:MAG: FAD-dependent oxidoreductase [Spirochaetota bacterium]
MNTEHTGCDVAVVGAGPAGMAAAVGARESGAESVLIIDRDPRLGGILPQCIHAGFGLEAFHRELTGPEYAEEYIGRLREMDVRCALDTTVLGVDSAGRLILSSAARGIRTLSAKAVVLAMGCRERTRANIQVPGYRPAGVFTAGTAQRLINMDGMMIGRRIVVVGSGDIGMIMARRCMLEGAEVPAVIELLPHPSGLGRNVAQCLEDFDIPLYLNHRLTFIEGKERVSGVRFRETGGEGGEDGQEKKLDCDTVLLSVGLIPEIELAAQMGIPLDPCTGGPVVDNAMQTPVPGIFACGNLVQVYDLVDWVSEDGCEAGKSAALYAGGELVPTAAGVPPGRAVRIEFDGGIRSVAPRLLKPYPHRSGRGTRVYVRMKHALKKPVFNLNVGGETIGAIRKPFAVPAEIVCLELEPYLDRVYQGGSLRIETQGEDLAYCSRGRTPGEITCVVCPFSCKVQVLRTGGTVEARGAGCERGRRYALAEAVDPRRVYTSTVKLAGGRTPRLSVRSSRPIRKSDWKAARRLTHALQVRAPVNKGQVVLHPFLEEGIRLVATRGMDAAGAGEGGAEGEDAQHC